MTEYIVQVQRQDGTPFNSVKYVEELIRCKDCKWYVVNELTKNYEIDRRRKPDYCEMHGRYREENWFCADGEKRV